MKQFFLAVVFAAAPILAQQDAALFANLKLAEPYYKDNWYRDTLRYKEAFTFGNPLVTTKFGADPYSITYKDTMYIYATGDRFLYNSDGSVKMNTADGKPNEPVGANYFRCYDLTLISSADLVNWTDHPDVPVAGASGQTDGLYRREDAPAKWAGVAWAPTAAYKMINGKMQFFLYFSDPGNAIGVLVADHPTGPFKVPSSTNDGRLIHRSLPNMSGVTLYDPGVLIDDDGKGYIYFGGGGPPGNSDAEKLASGAAEDPGNLRVVELNDDMVSLKPETVKKFYAPYVFEAASMNKIGNTYYFTYSTHFGPYPDKPKVDGIDISGGAIAYMTSDKPTEGFKYRGVLFSSPGWYFPNSWGNNHQAIGEFKGKYYFLYHARTLLSGMYNIGGDYRSTHIDPLVFGPNNSLVEVKGTDVGPAQVGRFNPYSPVSAATMATMAGIKTADYTINGKTRRRVTDINPGDWVALRGVDFDNSGAKGFTARVTVPQGKEAIMQIRVGQGLNGKPVGYLRASPGNNKTVSVDLLETVTGVHDLVFVFQGDGWHFEEWNFTKSSPSSSSSIAASSSSTGPLECNEYKATYCGGLAYGAVPSNSTAVPTTGNCLYIGDFEQIQPSLNSTVAINGLEISLGDTWDGADSTIVKEGNKKPAKKDGGYYVYVKAGGINVYQDNGWKNIVAKEKPACSSTPIAARSPLATSHSPITYYTLKGTPVGTTKPSKSGVYIEKTENQIRKIVVR